MKHFVEVAQDKTGKKHVILVDERFKVIEEVTHFLNHLELKRMAYNTIDSYSRCLKLYYDWLSSKKLKYDEVQKRNVINFISFLDKDSGSKPKAATTTNKYLAAISSFYDYHSNIKRNIINPFKSSESNKNYYLNKRNNQTKGSNHFFTRKVSNNTETKRLSHNQIVRFYEQLSNNTKYNDINTRNKLMFRVLYETGMRISECLALRMADYSEPDPIDEVGFIQIKQHPDIYHEDHSLKTLERTIPVSMDLLYEIDDYVSTYRPSLKNIKSIFVNHRGSTIGMYMTRKSVNKLFNQVSKKSEVKCTPHKLRHTHGTELIENGYEQEYVQHRLGHKDLDSTNKYVHISTEAQVTAYEKFMKSRRRK